MTQSLSQGLRAARPKSPHTRNAIDAAQTVGGAALGNPCEIRGHRQDRFALQGVARSLLLGEKPEKGRQYRVVNCMRALGHSSDGVSILRGPEGRAKFGGLQTCGSVWVCPCCSTKVTRHREREIQQAMGAHHAAGGFTIMVTFTHRHDRHDKLAPMVAAYSAAMRSMKSWRAYKGLRQGIGYSGEIRALEVTYGDKHGWHPHGHELWFIAAKPSPERLGALRLELFHLWRKACAAYGLPLPNEDHGVDVTVAMSAAEYIGKFGRDQKWGTAKELTRAQSKAAKMDKKHGKASDERFTPFDLLRAFRVGHRAAQMAMLFREYAAAYFGRRQLHWSKGLKARFGIEAIEDEEAAALVEAEHTIAGTISKRTWCDRVLRQPRDCRSAILDEFEQGGMDAVHRFIAGLPDIAGRHGTH